MEKTEKFYITRNRRVVSTCPVSDLFIPYETTGQTVMKSFMKISLRAISPLHQHADVPNFGGCSTTQFIVYLTTLSATRATQPWIVDNRLLSWKWRNRNRPRTNLSYHPNTWLEGRRSCSDTASSGSDWAYRRITELRNNNSSLGVLRCVDG
jgi:hypothetical protein